MLLLLLQLCPAGLQIYARHGLIIVVVVLVSAAAANGSHVHHIIVCSLEMVLLSGGAP